MNVCAPYTCLNPAFADDLQPSNLIGEQDWFNNQTCYIKVFPQKPKPPKFPVATTNVDPISDFVGAPICHNMQSFVQPFQICKRHRDVGNDKIKERNLWSERGIFGLNERPSIKSCLPGKVAFTRKGEPQSCDGILDTSNNRKDVSVESELIGRNHGPLIKNDTAVLDKQSRQICADQKLAERASPKNSLLDIYKNTKINPILLKEQLHNEFFPYANANTVIKKPGLFRNSTKSRMTNTIGNDYASSRTT